MKTRALALGTVVLACTAAGCVHPLGPGFQFEDRTTDIRPAADSPQEMHVRVTDRLQNAGDRTLHSLQLRLPSQALQSEANLHVTSDGRDVNPQPAPGASERIRELTFDPEWKQEQSRTITTEWDLPSPGAPNAAQNAAGGQAPVAGFQTADPAMLPLWLPPPGLFSASDARPPHEMLIVTAPSDFRVFAPGKPLRARSEGNATVHQFKITQNDPLPFVVAGRYQERIVRTGTAAVIFWTVQPMDAQQAQLAATRLAASYRSMSDLWGPSLPGPSTIHIAEGSGKLSTRESGIGGESFPGGALLDAAAIAEGINSEAVLEVCEYELARTWFGWNVLAGPETPVLARGGAARFGEIEVAEARGNDARQRLIVLFLNRYDEAQRLASAQSPEPDTAQIDAQRRGAMYKSALFFVALEDLCGRDKLSAALREIVRARGGSEMSEDDLRAAVEDAAGRNLADTFRAWSAPGIPQDFRARYANVASAAVN